MSSQKSTTLSSSGQDPEDSPRRFIWADFGVGVWYWKMTIHARGGSRRATTFQVSRRVSGARNSSPSLKNKRSNTVRRCAERMYRRSPTTTASLASKPRAGRPCSRYVILATGVRDHLPDIQGASEAVKRSLLRVCPICDAFEAIDKRIAVIGDGAMGEREAKFLSNYSDQVTLLDIASSTCAPAQELMGSRHIERIAISLSELKIKNDRVTLSSAQGKRDFDAVYLALGCSPQHELARSLRAACDDPRRIEGQCAPGDFRPPFVCGGRRGPRP